MPIPEPIPLGLTDLRAKVFAIVFASLVKMPFGGKVDTVLTSPTHFRLLTMARSPLAIPARIEVADILTVAKDVPKIRLDQSLCQIAGRFPAPEAKSSYPATRSQLRTVGEPQASQASRACPGLGRTA